MIYLCLRGKSGQGQYIFFYQHIYPALRRGEYLSVLAEQQKL